MPESPTNEAVDEALKRALSLERVSPDETATEHETEMPPQFGNNFYLLFHDLKDRKTCPPDRKMKYLWLEAAESLGEVWQQFLSENSELIAELDAVIEEQEIYSGLVALHRQFLNAGNIDGANTLNARADSSLGINAIGIPIWHRLNALLKRAAEEMGRLGINYRDICS